MSGASRRKGAGGAGKAAGKDYEVGYGRPPIATRFQPGGVGNPKGRPKREKAIGQIIAETLKTRVVIEENGRSKTVSALEVIIRNLTHAAARRDPAAIKILFMLLGRYGDSAETNLDPTDFATEDRSIIEDFLARERAAGISPEPDVVQDGADGPGDAGAEAPSDTSDRSGGSDGETP